MAATYSWELQNQFVSRLNGGLLACCVTGTDLRHESEEMLAALHRPKHTAHAVR
jgi:hypothetical protein